MRFLARPRWECDITTADKGDRLLVFLNVARDGTFTVAWSGRGLFLRQGDRVEAIGDVNLPPDLDDQGGLRLGKLVERVTKWRNEDLRPRTFRIARRKCVSCDGMTVARQLAGAGATDCSDPDMDAVTTCARAAKTSFATGVPTATERIFYATGADGVLSRGQFRPWLSRVRGHGHRSSLRALDNVERLAAVLPASHRTAVSLFGARQHDDRAGSAATPASDLFCARDRGGEHLRGLA